LFQTSYQYADLEPETALDVPPLSYLPVYIVARCAAEAREGVEQSVRAMGYDAVVWDDASIIPLVTTGAPGGDPRSLNLASSPH
jgi:hypothetical protein